ncbi:diguanylate cyclase (GGDEF) domain-containing protein [Treponema sp. JC4]|uniref:EAL domain-containing protein n=1 Tax=Treponema sp. JC4 TaxID=1124982 RepID=UPI00025B0BE1|nr:EAL domain-containing protein [Treponema sp. JC4]EID85756.1 diguanylate cyclase (GGDEF) domain-containing protein [Treponema sp. JC4]
MKKRVRIISHTISILCLIAAVFLLSFAVDKSYKHDCELTESVHKILCLCSYNTQYFTYEPQVTGLQRSLDESGIDYDVFFMDAKKYGTEHDIKVFHDFLKDRMRPGEYEAVILGDDNALLFGMKYQEELFKGLPMVFFGINDYDLATHAAQNQYITGFYEETYLDVLVELTSKLFPDSRKFVAIHDETVAGRSDEKKFYALSRNYPDYDFSDIDTSVLSNKEFIQAVKGIPSDAVIFFMNCYDDKEGNIYTVNSRAKTISRNSSCPIIRNYPGGENHGVLGGIYMDFENQCYLAGQTVAKILDGADVSKIPLVEITDSRCAFDWQMVKKYKLNTSVFQKGTIFYNKPATIFDYYGRILPAMGLIVTALLITIVFLNFSEAAGKRINAELKASRDGLIESEAQLRYLVDYDEVLDIFNRRTITNFITNELSPADKYSLVIIDIDGFKNLNESYGHHVADSILQYMVAVFKGICTGDDCKIARYGGDEFILYFKDRNLTPDDELIVKLMDAIHSPIPLGDESLVITASFGIANSDGQTLPERQVINAETAMYFAKDSGKNRVALYDSAMKKKDDEESHVKAKLQEAFDHDGFYMVYQPQINTKTKKVSGFEALVRMKEQGIYPGQFIPVAERNGWIWKIGRITTELVIKQLASWRDQGLKLYPVSINFSSNQLNDYGYIDFMKELLDLYKVPANLIEIEITEGLFLAKSALSDAIFKNFQEMGIKLLMDDFGTGYSSLGYLTYIPVDVIKLDKSLVDTYLVDGKDSFIKDIIRLMHDLGKEMIIEGVEEEWQYERLKEFEADIIQGYYFSKPLPADEAITFQPK